MNKETTANARRCQASRGQGGCAMFMNTQQLVTVVVVVLSVNPNIAWWGPLFLEQLEAIIPTNLPFLLPARVATMIVSLHYWLQQPLCFVFFRHCRNKKRTVWSVRFS